MEEHSFVGRLLGYKGNRGFQDFERWQQLMKVSYYLFGIEDEEKKNILDFLTLKSDKLEGEYTWDIQK